MSSIALGLLILFYSDIRGAKEFVSKDHFVDVISGAAITYAIALFACALILWFFGRFDGVSLSIVVGQIVVLGVPGVLGASAGRLLLQ